MLAIVIPYYKITFFEDTLKSLANQTNKNFNVYIGDDASQQNPEKLIEKYKSKINLTYKRFSKNLGSISLVKQWERCTDLAENEDWLMILGDDDVLGNNMVEEFYKCILKNDNSVNVVRFSTQKIDENNLPISIIYKHPKIEKSTDFLFRKTRSSLSEYIFNKKQVLDIGFKDFPLGWFSDFLAVLEFSSFNTVFSINNSIINIRISKLSISGDKNNLVLKSLAKFQFYYFLISNNSQFFSKREKDLLGLELNKYYLNNKRKFHVFFKISILYIAKSNYKAFFKFLRSIIINFYKNK